MSRVPWVVACGAIGELAHCTRCGEGLRIAGPMRIDTFVGAGKGFIKAHRHCRGAHTEPEIRTPADWIASRDVGVSAATIWSVMTDQPSPYGRYDVPHDGADLARCRRLLNRFPYWRQRLAEVADCFPEWAPIVKELQMGVAA